ncbi:hypothetical protein BCR34DRAFT_174257 [Clohesyomyces aquaticus]|uniref:Uncharacterized protein n=1 Tax=Clohesyomyces aquaticus TaxID=1231657 RepID=A0A1Y1YFY5_9PLEO|nr:hypothetical protein BCR34DRAFT_174257 [Clohesyomyces aquaticus]
MRHWGKFSIECGLDSVHLVSSFVGLGVRREGHTTHDARLANPRPRLCPEATAPMDDALILHRMYPAIVRRGKLAPAPCQSQTTSGRKATPFPLGTVDLEIANHASGAARRGCRLIGAQGLLFWAKRHGGGEERRGATPALTINCPALEGLEDCGLVCLECVLFRIGVRPMDG